MPDELSRRSFIVRAGATALAPWGAQTSAARRAPELLRGGSFDTGVLAGLPRLDGANLCARVAGARGSGLVRAEVSVDADFRRVVHRTRVDCRGANDHVAHALVTSKRIRPGEQYYYRFATRRRRSQCSGGPTRAWANRSRAAPHQAPAPRHRR
jgi:alkaline phosphatase D